MSIQRHWITDACKGCCQYADTAAVSQRHGEADRRHWQQGSTGHNPSHQQTQNSPMPDKEHTFKQKGKHMLEHKSI